MEVLTLNGRTYVKASKAARDLGYTSDYVGQLCRSGTVDAHLVGRTWYVNPETLGAHRVEKKRIARVKAREQARKSIEEARSLKVQQNAKTYKNIDIRYEEDSEELIPEVRKVSIQSHQERVVVPEESGEKYTVENKNEKIVLSGTLSIEDAELEEEFTDTTILTPKIQRAHRVGRPAVASKEVAAEVVEEDEPVVEEEHHSTFVEKLGAREAVLPTVTEAEPLPEVAPQSSRASRFAVPLTVLILICLGASSLFIAQTVSYSEGGVESSYRIDKTVNADFTAYLKVISDKLP